MSRGAGVTHPHAGRQLPVRGWLWRRLQTLAGARYTLTSPALAPKLTLSLSQRTPAESPSSERPVAAADLGEAPQGACRSAFPAPLCRPESRGREGAEAGRGATGARGQDGAATAGRRSRPPYHNAGRLSLCSWSPSGDGRLGAGALPPTGGRVPRENSKACARRTSPFQRPAGRLPHRDVEKPPKGR